MGSETPHRSSIVDEPDPKSYFLEKFRLYETRSNFYMIGRDKNRTFWKVLKISREELSDLSILEDSTTYTDNECFELLKRIHEGNKSTGGLKFVSTCYGIVGIVKFLGPYYMLLITKRRKIGSICGHAIYAITKSEMIPIPNALVRSKVANSNDENRYKKLLCSVDLRKDFFFSYSYYVIRSLQKNLCDCKTGHFLYETMFVWNEFLTRGMRNALNNTIWTVALVYGFFKQVDLSISSKNFSLTIIARRSRHYAGTRYLKRGVNEKGRVANDVEIEQIVFENTSDGQPIQISSIVQNRGSIPLFWSQETSRMNIKPDIILSKKDHSYEATRLHFENLVNRYGNPIIILNLIKTHEKKPRETILRNEFANAIRFINNGLTERNRLKFLHWDLNRHSRSKATNVLAQLGRVATYALNLTGIFHCQMISNSSTEGLLSRSCLKKSSSVDCSLEDLSIKSEDAEGPGVQADNSHCGYGENGNSTIAPITFQTGVLRTNCIDCLDRTNVAQYAYGLVALARQLNALGLTESPTIDLDSMLAKDLMEMYENMGDTLALQYGGSAAHNKIFSERRGQWRPATQSQEFFRTLQRYYSNAYVDAEKQNAINVFLGYFQPQPGKPALWELDSDQHYNIGKRPLPNDENLRTIKRSLSDGNILRECESCLENLDDRRNQPFSATPQGCERGISESSPEISASRTEISDYRYTPSVCSRKFFGDAQEVQWSEIDHICHDKHGDLCNCSNFLDVDWLSSSGNSCEDELCERSIASLSSDTVANDLKTEMTPSASESGSGMKAREQTAPELLRSDILNKYSENFVEWVTHGGVLFR